MTGERRGLALRHFSTTLVRSILILKVEAVYGTYIIICCLLNYETAFHGRVNITRESLRVNKRTRCELEFLNKAFFIEIYSFCFLFLFCYFSISNKLLLILFRFRGAFLVYFISFSTCFCCCYMKGICLVI